MTCKVAERDIETEEVDWQRLGSSTPTTASRPKMPAPATTQTRPALPSTVERRSGEAAAGEGMKRTMEAIEQRHLTELDQTRRSAFEQGQRQGRQEAASEMEEALNRLARTIHDLAQVKTKIRVEAENELVKLSLAIARRILHRELTADPQSLRGVVYAALQRLQNRELTKIRVFPPSVPAVRAALERNGGLASIEIVPDGMLAPGGLALETSSGELDASVETQLEEIERGFADRLAVR